MHTHLRQNLDHAKSPLPVPAGPDRVLRRRTARTLMAIVLAAGLAACGNGAPGEKGDPGPPGPQGAKGDAGPRGPAGPATGGMRIVRASCDATNCAAQCADDEVLLIAYCGAMRNPAVFPSERAASCRTRGPANSPLVAACAKSVTQ